MSFDNTTEGIMPLSLSLLFRLELHNVESQHCLMLFTGWFAAIFPAGSGIDNTISFNTKAVKCVHTIMIN